jgi:hypothetical protein
MMARRVILSPTLESRFMRAEALQLVEDIKQSIGLLRRHL